MDTDGLVLVTLQDLLPGVVMASGHVVESIESGTHRVGDSVHVLFANGSTGVGGKLNRVWVQAGSIVEHRDGYLF